MYKIIIVIHFTTILIGKENDKYICKTKAIKNVIVFFFTYIIFAVAEELDLNVLDSYSQLKCINLIGKPNVPKRVPCESKRMASSVSYRIK